MTKRCSALTPDRASSSSGSTSSTRAPECSTMYSTSGRGQAEVDRHEDAPAAAHPEEAREQPGRVLAHHRHPLALADPERVEPGGLRPRPFGHLAPGELAPGGGRLVRFVDHPDPIGVDQLGPAQEVVDRERNLHVADGISVIAYRRRGGRTPDRAGPRRGHPVGDGGEPPSRERGGAGRRRFGRARRWATSTCPSTAARPTSRCRPRR